MTQKSQSSRIDPITLANSNESNTTSRPKIRQLRAPPIRRETPHHGVGAHNLSKSDGVEDQAHRAALRSVRITSTLGHGGSQLDCGLMLNSHVASYQQQQNTIELLKDYNLTNRQLRDLYSGQGTYGIERFLREEDHSVYSQSLVNVDGDSVISSTSGFTFYRPPGALSPSTETLASKNINKNLKK